MAEVSAVVHDGILGTSISWDHLEEVLTKALGTTAKFGENKKVERIGTMQGFVSKMGRIHADWTDTSQGIPQTFVVKIPTIDVMKEMTERPKMKETFETIAGNNEKELYEKFENMVSTLHNAEAAFYRIVLANDLHIRVPKCYVIEEFTDKQSQGYFVMEDLGTDAHIIPAFQSVSPNDLLQVFEVLAEVHAFSMNNDEWRSTKTFSFSEMMKMSNQTQGMVAMVKLTVNLDNERMDPLMKKFEKYIEKICDANILNTVCDEMGISTTMVHGDLWSANVMWRTEGEKNKLAAVIDWQVIHSGCVSEDLARIICCTLTAKDRRENWENLIETYFEMLTKKLGRDPPFTIDQVKRAFLRILPFAAVMVMPVFGAITQTYAQENKEVKSDNMVEILREKAVGLLEDILHYYEMFAVTE